ncbi:hypothetical protein [Sodalis sp. dw_96]|uniref:hypothetical protein n=1 Tax=Sodalis sp. dw_96 TaxID=2719794 RepID=UPI001BD331D4|nr:hypothetical protein [Sodalis sp. dw_96]
MHISTHKTGHNIIDRELLSNSTNSREYKETLQLFDALKAIRTSENIQLAIPKIQGKKNWANNAVRLLFASVLSPINFSLGNITTNKHNSLSVNVDSRTVKPILGLAAPMAYNNAGVSILANKISIDISSRDTYTSRHQSPRRVVRGTDEKNNSAGNTLYLPSVSLATKNIENFLTARGLIDNKTSQGKTDLINAAVDYISNHSDGMNKIAKHLIRHSGLFGAKKNEKISEFIQQKTVMAWMHSLLFADGVEVFTVNEFIRVYQNESLGKVVSTHHFAAHLSETVRHGLTVDCDTRERAGLNKSSLAFIDDNIFIPIMPTFYFNTVQDASMTYSIGSLEWGYLHAGMGFAMSAEMNLQSISANELVSLGIFLDSMLREGLSDPSLIKLFILPAIFYQVKYSLDNGIKINIDDVMDAKEIKQEVLERYFLACDKFNEMIDPVMYLSQALASYQTRTKLAEELISTNCAAEDQTGVPYISLYKYYNNYIKCADVIDGAKNAVRQLPPLDVVFEKQNADIADAFANVDKRIIYNAISGIDAHEVDFLAGAEVQKVRVGFAHRMKPHTALGYLAFSQYDNLSLRSNVDVFSAKKDNKERIYALINEKEGYRVKRVDENVVAYFELLKIYRSELETDNNIKLNLQKGRWQVLQTATQSLKVFATTLSQIHRDNMFEYLNALGYDKTAAEKTRDFFLSLIPLYDCITYAQGGKEGEAVAACSMDALMLAPFVGKGLSMSAKAATKFGFGSRIALGEFASGFAAGQSLRMAMKNGVLQLSRFAALPASRELNRVALSELGVEFLRLFDPGLEITGRMSGAILKRVIQGADIVGRSLPALDKVLAALRAKKIDPFTPPGNPYQMARLPALKREVPVVKLDGDTLHGKAIYVRINPENNDIFGRKYTLAEDKTLVPVPLRLSKRLINLRTQGLGGLGGKVRARQWMTEQRSLSDEVHESLRDVVLSPANEHIGFPGMGHGHGSAAGGIERSWRAAYAVEKHLPKQFFIKTFGDRDSESILFPELGVPLHQNSLDATEYERAFARLSENEKTAVRTWSLVEDDVRSFSDGTPNLTWLNKKPINVELNQKLRDGIPFTPEEKEVHDGLMAFLRADIPRQHGSYLRIAEYRQGQRIPWPHDIAVGDIVTNHPQLMSVSADDGFARLFAEQAAEDGPEIEQGLEALVIYRIDNGETCTPLLPMAASTVIDEVEYLYPPKTYFRVKGISIADGISQYIFPRKRIGVILEEITEVPFRAKNLFSGYTYLYDLPPLARR